jgi:RNA polymerase sigma-70 factor, ECF subfamily
MEATATPSVTQSRALRDESDERLLARLAAGQDDALAELYDRHGRVAFGLAFRVLGDRGLAEDAVQEAFLAAWRSAPRFRPDCGMARAWFMNIVHRRAVDLVRREERRRSVPPAEVDLVESAEDVASLADERRGTRMALDRLPDRLLSVLELAYYGGLTQSEIAAQLGVPLGTVKSRTSAALARLGQLLEERADAPNEPPSSSPERRSGPLERVMVEA